MTPFLFDILVTTGGIEPFLRNVDYPSIVVFLNMLFLIYYHAPNTLIPVYAILNIGLGFC